MLNEDILMVWVEPWAVPAMLTGDKIIDVARDRAINTDLFTLGQSR
jgi:hypothetical protein